MIVLYDFILLNKKIPHIESESIVVEILKSLDEYFRTGKEDKDFRDKLMEYRSYIYRQDNPIDIYYVDILIAVAMEAKKKSAWFLLPLYSQNSIDEWSEYLQKSNAIRILWPSQQLIGETGILSGEKAIVQLPTGVGKTRSIELIIRAAFLADRASTAIVVAPLRALCNEITSDLNQAFDDEVFINQFSDVLQEDFLLDLSYLLKKRIIICTPEKLSYIMHHQVDVLTDIDLFIFDEGHMFDDGNRGVLYELLVSEIRSRITEEKQVVLLSAVLSNAEQIKEWMFNGAGVLATSGKIKATPKAIGFTSKTKDINYFSDDANESDFYIPKSLAITQLKKNKGERAERYFPIMTDAKDIAIYYALKLCHNGGVAIYVNRTDSVLTVIRRILDLHSREYDFTKLASVTDDAQAEKLHDLIKAYYGEAHEFTRAARLGIFPHYSDLPNGIKLAIEYAIRHDQVRFVVCTSTLAQGVNIPIKFLFMTSFRLKQNSMQIRNFQNLIGRTARSGIYTEGSVVVTDTKFYDQRTDRQHGGNYRWKDCIKMFDPNAAEPCSSSILSIVKDIFVDYEISFKGKGIAKIIIENYERQDCFESLSEKLSAGFLKLSPGKTPSTIVSAVMYRKSIIDSIENHLCFAYSNREWTDFEELAVSICGETLAYALADEEEKELLIELFLVISRKVNSYGDARKIQKFACTMIGIDLSCRIEAWIGENEILDVFYTEEQLLAMIISFFEETHKLKTSLRNFNILCEAWISGKMFEELQPELAPQLNINLIEDICSKTISYELSFFIGNIMTC